MKPSIRWSGPKFRPQIAIGLLLVAGVAVGCGSSTKGSSAPTTSGSATSGGTTATSSAVGATSSCSTVPGVTPTEVKIGVMSDLTGGDAVQNIPFSPGVTAAIDAANAAGGINGRKIVVVTADSQSSPSAALSAVKGLVQSNGVFAVLPGPATEATIWPYLASQPNLPVIAPLAGSPDFGTAKNFFSTTGAWDAAAGGTLTGPIIAKYLQNSGAKTVAVFSHPDPASLGFSGAIAQAVKGDGLTIVYQDLAVPYSAFDATSVALRVKQAAPDATIAGLSIQATVSILKSLQQQNVPTKVNLITTGYDPSVLSVGIAGTTTTASYVPYLGSVSTLSAPAQAFRNAMAQYEPKTNLGLYAVGGYATGSLFLHGLELAGKCPTQAGFVSALRSVTSYNPGGMDPGPINYAPNSISADGSPINCEYFVKINTSSFTVPTAPICL